MRLPSIELEPEFKLWKGVLGKLKVHQAFALQIVWMHSI